MARPRVGPETGCALHGAILTASAIQGVVPLVHSTPGCALRAGGNALPPVPSTNLADKHIVFGGTSRLREEIKNALAVVPSGLVTVLTGCPTEMIGDDVAAMVKEVTTQGETVIDVPVAGFRGSARHGYEVLLSALAARLELSGDAEDDAALVNIFGIVPHVDPHWLGDLDEIARMLVGAGLRANVIVGPAGGLASLHAMAKARVSLVLSPWGLGPAQALADRYGIPVLVADGLPVGWDASRALLERLIAASGQAVTASASRFFATEGRFEDFLLNEALEGLALLGHRRCTVVGGSHVVTGISRFLESTFGWPVAVIVTDDPSEAARPALLQNHACVEFLPDASGVAKLLRARGDDLVFGNVMPRAANSPVSTPLHRTTIDALTSSYVGRRGTAHLLAAILIAQRDDAARSNEQVVRRSSPRVADHSLVVTQTAQLIA